MKNIYSNIFKFNKKTLNKTKKLLKENNIVGLPTETVYGLAGNAYSNKAIRKIFKLKNRPKINPLIVHYHNLNDASKDIQINENFIKLFKFFSPGPITFIVNKKINSKIVSMVTSKLQTVAIRFPSHPIIKKILKELKFPLAMPSANKSSSISPVSAKDVLEEFKRSLKVIIDGGDAKIGLESTVVDVTNGIKILRPGIISPKEISKILKKKVRIFTKTKLIKAPGNLQRHYSPGIPIKLNVKKPPKNGAFITFGKNYLKNKNTFNLSSKANLKEAAKNLYKVFRKIKKLKYKNIYIVKIPNEDIGIAINDRIKRAAN